MLRWWRKRRKNRQWQEFREWYQQSEEARTFTFLKCLFCRTPASSADANFCSHCGASFHTPPGQYTTTEPLQKAVDERPFEAYRRKLHQQPPEGVQTTKYRTVRLDRSV